MKNLPEQPEQLEQRGEKFGVLDYRIENNYYVVHIRWKDGKETEHNFPERGFGVFDPDSGGRKGFINGRDALKILEQHSLNTTEKEFSWLDFINSQ